MKTMNFGIDIGYMSTKRVSRRGDDASIAETQSFPSVAGTPDLARLSVAGKRSASHLVTFGDNRYLVGQSAIRQSRMSTRREDRHWFMSEEYLALLYTALALSIGDTHRDGSQYDINLVTGLPVAFFDDQKALEEILSTEHQFTYNGLSYRVNIPNPYVVMQPFGTYLDYVFPSVGTFDEQFADRMVGVLDGGSKTTNLLTVQGIEEIRQSTTSVEIGGWEIVRAVRERIVSEFPGLSVLKDHQIAQAIVNRHVHSFGAQRDIGQMIDETVKPFSDEILAHASAVWNSGEVLDEIIVTGGAAYLIFGDVAKVYPHARRSADPVFANAIGYWKYAEYLNS